MWRWLQAVGAHGRHGQHEPVPWDGPPPTLTSPVPPLRLGGRTEGVQDIQARQLTVRQELLPQMNLAFEKLLKNGIFSFRQPQNMWGGGKQESNHHPLPPCISPHSAQEGASTDHRVGRQCQKRPTSGQDLGRKRGGEQAGLGGPRGDPGRASARLPRICLHRSNYAPAAALPRLRHPPRSPHPPPQPHASPLGAEQEDHMEGIIRQLTFH